MGCRQVLGLDPGTVRADAALSDADALEDAQDAPDMLAIDAFTGWKDIAIVPGLAAGDEDPSLTSDMLELYFTRGNDVYFTTRTSVTSAWATPQLAMFTQMGLDQTPEMTPEGLFLQFATDRGAGGGMDIYVVTRSSRTSNWSTAIEVNNLNETGPDDRPGSANITGERITMSSTRNGNGTGLDLYQSFRPGALGTAYDVPTRIPLSTDDDDSSPFLTNDGLTLYYASGPATLRNLYVATRPSVTAQFVSGAPISELNTAFNESDPWVSPDGKEIYFTSNRDGANRIYHASRL